MNNSIYLILFMVLFSVWPMTDCRPDGFSPGRTEKEAAKKAEELHEQGQKGVLYAQDDTKALYFQNVQIIEILKDIRRLLEENAKGTE